METPSLILALLAEAGVASQTAVAIISFLCGGGLLKVLEHYWQRNTDQYDRAREDIDRFRGMMDEWHTERAAWLDEKAELMRTIGEAQVKIDALENELASLKRQVNGT